MRKYLVHDFLDLKEELIKDCEKARLLIEMNEIEKAKLLVFSITLRLKELLARQEILKENGGMPNDSEN